MAIIHISAKCSDLFAMQDSEGNQYDGHVPEFFPEDHFGDYVILSIDTKTGKILNWQKKISDAQVAKVFYTHESYYAKGKK